MENRIYISRYPTHDEHSDYINAVPVDGFRFKEQFIVTQTPLPNTVIDFWRMVAEKEVKVIVSLNGIPVDDEVNSVTVEIQNNLTRMITYSFRLAAYTGPVNRKK